MERVYKSLPFVKTLSGIMLVFGMVVLVSDTDLAESQEPKRNIEMGTVNWNRDLDAALRLSSQTDKPLFVLFQEIPG